MLKSLVLLAASASTGLAAVVSYDWDIEWVNAAPDGFTRPVIGINGAWPLPTIQGTVGDLVVVNINNKLGNETTGIHFHGIHQIGTNHMDGPAGVTQCPVPPGSSFTYKFFLDQAGSYWYHSHTGAQYPDGLRGALIVKDLIDPYAGQYDEEYVLTVSDWYHGEVPNLLPVMLNSANVQERPPLPVAGLINDGAGSTLKFEAGKKYKIRLINISAFTSAFFFLEDHDLSVIEVDGAYTHAATASQLYISPAQRYSFIVEAKSDATKNYAFSAVFDINPDFHHPVIPWLINATGVIEYDASFGTPPPVTTNAFTQLDDFTLNPLTNPGLSVADTSLQLDFTLAPDAGGVPRGWVNGKNYVGQKVPTLYTALTVGDDATDPTVYGEVNPFIVDGYQVVELVVNNLHFANHPFHLHGHHFQVCSRPVAGTGQSDGSGVECADDALVRDVILINANSSAVIRFKSDNPGVWLFHCHIEWHVAMGLSATIIEAPLEIQKRIVIPKQHIDACIHGCLPYEGNAGGDTTNHTDLSAANNLPPAVDQGALFTISTCTAPSASSTAWPSSSAVPSGSVVPSGSALPSSSAVPTGSAIPSSWSGDWTTSTLYSTTTYTVTSCAATVTNCPAKPWVTTEVVPYTTTVCPVTATETAKETGPVYPSLFTPSALWSTATVTNTAGEVATETLAWSTTLVPHNDLWPTPTTASGTWGTGAVTPTTTGSGLTVTAAAGKAASGFGAAAFAGVLAAAALL